ncbi:phage holin family protein [Litorihabitans aurantiacus]|uniref:Membrane protein n=1 Tax=Litorihabitans aurantiacus TaxID=1930061 RepID=A0AA38CVE1_9MICO|nr:phage holin family protein [Litorihabitans aurantiacus]GMA32800.1 membrane protein [Litorihabitans aurantiacus]
MKELLWRSVVSAGAVWVADALIRGISVTEVAQWWQQVLVYLVVGAVLAIVQMIIKPIVAALTFLLYILTLGLFGIVVNALMLMLVSAVTGNFAWGLQVDGFWPAAVLGGIVVSIATMILAAVLPRPQRRRG